MLHFIFRKSQLPPVSDTKTNFNMTQCCKKFFLGGLGNISLFSINPISLVNLENGHVTLPDFRVKSLKCALLKQCGVGRRHFGCLK